MKRNLPSIWIACFLLAASCSTRTDHDAPKEGTDFFAVAPTIVEEIRYGSAKLKIYAARWSGEEAFRILFTPRGSASQHCLGGDRFSGWLNAISRVTITGERKGKVDFSTGESAQIQMWDKNRQELIDMMIFLPTASNSPISLIFDGRQFPTGLDPAILLSASAGCSAFGLQQ
jgi:hypothetical protein